VRAQDQGCCSEARSSESLRKHHRLTCQNINSPTHKASYTHDSRMQKRPRISRASRPETLRPFAAPTRIQAQTKIVWLSQVALCKIGGYATWFQCQLIADAPRLKPATNREDLTIAGFDLCLSALRLVSTCPKRGGAFFVSTARRVVVRSVRAWHPIATIDDKRISRISSDGTALISLQHASYFSVATIPA
jgi:hypothetical protein